MKKRMFALSVAALICCSSLSFINAEDAEIQEADSKSKEVSWIDAQTISIVRIRPKKIDMDATEAFIHETVPALDEILAQSNRLADVETFLTILQESSAEECFVVVSMADPLSQIPFLVFEDPDVSGLEPIVAAMGRVGGVLERYSNAAVLASPTVHRRLASARPYDDTKVREVLGSVDRALTVAIVPNDDHRRAFKELMPAMPELLGGGDSAIVAEGVQWGVFSMDFPPNAAVEVVVQSADDRVAADLSEWYAGCLEILSRSPELKATWPSFADSHEMLLPKVEDNRLVYKLEQKEERFQALVSMFRAPVVAVTTHANRQQAVNNMKQLAIAMHNYYDSHSQLPGYGSVDENGEPLLSWRVHILPFVEQGDLYNEFHLDEPWDSEHNRTLISKMPEIYVPLNSKLSRTDGKSNVRAPAGDDAMFPNLEGVKFNAVRDGLSNTIMLAEVPDEQAVIWTKPDRFEPDFEMPEKFLGGHFDQSFLAALGDGSVRFFSLQIDGDVLAALFTMDGGETIDYRQLDR